MTPLAFMVVAGEASGDLLAAELIAALRDELAKLQGRPSKDLQPLEASLVPRFFGAGGPRMREAGVQVVCDMTEHAVIGPTDALKKYGLFRRYMRKLCRLAIEHEPDAVICVDFSGFNLRLASALRSYAGRRRRKPFYNWDPCLVQYVSPQVWASRPGRARHLERSCDLLLSIFPFEKDWYALRAPKLPVEYVGHPVVDRYASAWSSGSKWTAASSNVIALLPGSRQNELLRHLPILCQAAHRIAAHQSAASTTWGCQFQMVLPSPPLAETARRFDWPAGTDIRAGRLAETLSQATLALACTGTVTMECAYFGVPTIAFYKTSWLTYQIARRLVTVGYLAMPNVLLGYALFPEFIQQQATAENVAAAATELLENKSRRFAIREALQKLVANLGPPGAARRAARAIIACLSRGG